MRFLGLGDTCDLSAMYARLAAEGHEVRVHATEPLCRDVLAGIVPQVGACEPEIDWVRAAGPDGVVLIENVAKERGALAERLRAEGVNVIGGSAWGDKLENDRLFAQGVLADIGLATAPVREFENAAAALPFVEAHPGRYVIKLNGSGFGAAANYVGQLEDGRDVLAMLRAHARRDFTANASLVLMDYLDGVEIGVGAYFNGERFLEPAVLDWEHKRFFTGDLGELTAEMGTVVTFERSRAFFERTLKPLEALLRANHYLGYINLNTIVNERGIWPLEFTCRFGYPGYAIMDPLQDISWAHLFRGMIDRSLPALPVRPGFCVGVVMTTRPFPYIRNWTGDPIGLPVMFRGELTDDERRHVHYGEVGLEDGELVTAGYHGWTLVLTGVGPDVAAAQAGAYALAERLVVPNLRYRLDIGDKLKRLDLARLEALGLMGD